MIPGQKGIHIVFLLIKWHGILDHRKTMERVSIRKNPRRRNG